MLIWWGECLNVLNVSRLFNLIDQFFKKIQLDIRILIRCKDSEYAAHPVEVENSPKD